MHWVLSVPSAAPVLLASWPSFWPFLSSIFDSIFTSAIPLGQIAVRTVLCYVAMLVLLRLAGKREIGQLTTFDVVVLLMIGNAVQNAMVGADSSVSGGIVSASVLIGVSYLTAVVGLHSAVFERAVRGEPSLLVNHGAFITRNLRKEGIDPDEVLMAMREHGIDSLAEVKSAWLEIDGSISIVPVATATIRTRPLRHVRFLRHGG
ncbi:MAG TPA: YetF domain-containing protein [Chloroflexota bacterium]|nr:YetF domain-containing protein [Chloroflexota bacterium]